MDLAFVLGRLCADGMGRRNVGEPIRSAGTRWQQTCSLDDSQLALWNTANRRANYCVALRSVHAGYRVPGHHSVIIRSRLSQLRPPDSQVHARSLRGTRCPIYRSLPQGQLLRTQRSPYPGPREVWGQAPSCQVHVRQW